MTDHPPPIPYADSASASPIDPVTRSPRYVRSARVAWTIILLLIGFIVVAVNVLPALRPGRRAREAARAEAHESSDFRAAARMAMGTHALALFANPNAKPDASRMKPVDDAAKTMLDKLYAAIIAGEIEGADAAIARLDKIGPIAAATPARDPLAVVATTAPSSTASGTDALNADVAALQRMYTSTTRTSSAESASAPPAALLSAAEREGLVSRHDRYGEIALTFGTSPEDPSHRAVLEPAMLAILTFVGVFIATLIAAIAGFVLLIIAIVRLADGKVTLRFQPARPQIERAVFVEAFAVYIVLFMFVSLLIELFVKKPSILLSMIATAILPVVLLWPVWRGASWREVKLGFGWHLGAGTGPLRALREMWWGVVGYITALPLVIGMLLLSLLISRAAGVKPTHPIQQELAGGAGSLVAVYILACLWAPLMEETMFRGALFNHLRRRSKWLISAVTTGVLFAAIHPQGWALVPALGTIGVVLAGIREWRGGLLASMTAHALNNFVMLTLAASMLS